jgi:hypothetical protein
LIGIGIIVCYPELKEDPARNRVLGRMADMMETFTEAEHVAAGAKVSAMVRQDKARFCESIAYGVSQVLNK